MKEREQLSALAEVHELLTHSNIEYWLFGGWAVDFYAGAITRAHDDVDLAVWLDDLPRIADLLGARGWRHAPSDDEDGGTAYERDGTRLELTFLARGGDGSVWTPLRSGRGEWPMKTFGDEVRELESVRARVIDFASLKQGKARARTEAADEAKDRADSATLSRLGVPCAPSTRRSRDGSVSVPGTGTGLDATSPKGLPRRE